MERMEEPVESVNPTSPSPRPVQNIQIELEDLFTEEEQGYDEAELEKIA